MRREDLMKSDPLSNILLLSSGIVMVAALVTVIMLALVHAASAVSTTSPSATYSLLPMCCHSQSPYKQEGFIDRLDIAGLTFTRLHNALRRRKCDSDLFS